MLTHLNALVVALTMASPLLLPHTLVVAHAAGCCDPASPFREGEGLADTPATCSDIAKWAQLAPKTNDRITMSIRGKLSKVETSSALVYLTMCEPGQLQVFCVTYETNGMRAGDTVLFAGGYERSATGQVVLDPCLASRE
ncbi:MAG: hypothetical protein AB7E81_07095 [Hyphomicrobiaceae bacterium]